MPKTKVNPNPSTLADVLGDITEDSLPDPVIEKMKAWIIQEGTDKAKDYRGLVIAWFNVSPEVAAMTHKLALSHWIILHDDDVQMVRNHKVVRSSKIVLTPKLRQICR